MCVNILFFYKCIIILKFCFVTCLSHGGMCGDCRPMGSYLKQIVSKLLQALESGAWQRIGNNVQERQGLRQTSLVVWALVLPPIAGWPLGTSTVLIHHVGIVLFPPLASQGWGELSMQ